jgi:hypothetical protein
MHDVDMTFPLKQFCGLAKADTNRAPLTLVLCPRRPIDRAHPVPRQCLTSFPSSTDRPDRPDRSSRCSGRGRRSYTTDRAFGFAHQCRVLFFLTTVRPVLSFFAGRSISPGTRCCPLEGAVEEEHPPQKARTLPVVRPAGVCPLASAPRGRGEAVSVSLRQK